MNRQLLLPLSLLCICAASLSAQPRGSAEYEVLHVFQNGYSYDQLHCFREVDPENSYAPTSLIVLDDGSVIVDDFTVGRIKIFGKDLSALLSLPGKYFGSKLQLSGSFLVGYVHEAFVADISDPGKLRVDFKGEQEFPSVDLVIGDNYFFSLDLGPNGSSRLFRIISCKEISEIPYTSFVSKAPFTETFTKEIITSNGKLKGYMVLRSNKRGYIAGYMSKFAAALSSQFDTKPIENLNKKTPTAFDGDFLCTDGNGLQYFFKNGFNFQNASRIFVVDQKARILATFEPDRDFDDYTVMSTPSVTSNGDIYYLESNADRGHKLIRIKNTWDPEGRARVDAAPPIHVLPAMKPWTATLNDGSVRLRKDQNTESAVLGLLQKGQKVRIFEQSFQKMAIGALSAYWYYVRTDDNKEGWVYGAYLTIDT